MFYSQTRYEFFALLWLKIIHIVKLGALMIFSSHKILVIGKIEMPLSLPSRDIDEQATEHS